MTVISVDKVNGITTFAAGGHAEYCSDGNDIVCAAVSILSQSLLQSLKYYESVDKCKIIKEKINESVGSLEVVFKTYSNTEIDAVLNTILIGFSMLQSTFPDNVKII